MLGNNENVTPAGIGGMGPVVLPMNGGVGSGDVPAGKGDAEKEYKKKKKKRMKHLKYFEQFLNEKSYRMTGVYAAKGLVGKVMQAFRQEIKKVKYEGINVVTQEEVNKEWAKFEDTAKKIILDQVEKGAGDMDGVLYVTANLFNGFAIDAVNGLNDLDPDNTLYLSYEVVINVGFMDDFNGKKVARKIDKTGMMNSPLASKRDVIYGDYDAAVGNNNLEIRDTEVIQIDKK